MSTPMIILYCKEPFYKNTRLIFAQNLITNLKKIVASKEEQTFKFSV